MIRVETHPRAAWPLWSAEWEALAAASQPESFFLTPPWVETWLEVFGPGTRAKILVFHETAGNEVVGLCLLTESRARRGPFRIRRVHLNAAGEDEADEACTEYNALLCRPGREDAVAAALAAHLEGEPWDELLASGMSPGPSLVALVRSLGRGDVSRTDVETPFVDLRPLDEHDESYLKTLSRNTREQIRRSRRGLEAMGPLRVREAADFPGAEQLLKELAALHTASWNARGKPGVFASPLFRDFHERLVKRAFPRGAIQLLRVTAGETTLAALYNFVHAGKAYFYQSGLRLDTDKRLKVGLVAHAAAIVHCRARGLVEYDFLAGDDQYKKSLATGSRSLSWLVFRNRGVRSKALGAVRAAKRALRTRPR